MSEDLAADAASVNEAIKDKPPEMAEAAPTTVKLLRGVLSTDTGKWQKTATVREMTGEDEEELARLSTNDDLTYAEYTSALLNRAVMSVGSQKVADNPTLIDDLLIGDRDMLFLGVIKATYGNLRDFTVTCGSCSSTSDVQVDLDKDFPITEAKESLTKARKVTMKDGTEVQVKYLTGKDAQAIASSGETIAEQTTAIVANSVVWDDDRTIAVKQQWAKAISIADRKKIVNTVLDDQPGPSMEEVEAPCAHCDEPIVMMLDWASLLYS
jgi:hypothetical protein